MLHDGGVFASIPTDAELHRADLHLREPAKLTVISIAADKTFLKPSRASTRRLNVLMAAVCQNLHPLGSVVACVPHPWSLNLGRIAGERIRYGLACVYSAHASLSSSCMDYVISDCPHHAAN